MNAVKPLPALGEVKRVGEVEDALGVGEVVVAAAAVEEAVDKFPLFLADQSFNRTLENNFSNHTMLEDSLKFSALLKGGQDIP